MADLFCYSDRWGSIDLGLGCGSGTQGQMMAIADVTLLVTLLDREIQRVQYAAEAHKLGVGECELDAAYYWQLIAVRRRLVGNA
jgi:hypothetical protein